MEHVALNDRGFLTGKFTDHYGYGCSIQESSAIGDEDTGSFIWLGIDNPKVMKDLRSGPGEVVEFEGDYTFFSRMHLSQVQVKELLPSLQYFAECGCLPNPEEHAKFVEHIKPANDIVASYFEEVSS